MSKLEKAAHLFETIQKKVRMLLISENFRNYHAGYFLKVRLTVCASDTRFPIYGLQESLVAFTFVAGRRTGHTASIRANGIPIAIARAFLEEATKMHAEHRERMQD